MDDPITRKLSHLILEYPVLNILGSLDRTISSVAFDSRKVEKGGLFVAIHGFHQDGAAYVRDALERGAVAFVTEVPIESMNSVALGSRDITAIRVNDSRDALSAISATFYNHPSRRLNLIGVTGTNGKTTLTYILESIYQARNEGSGIIGSIHYHYGNHDYRAPVTTPESLDINRMLHEMTQDKIRHCFLEVSSHSLTLKRVKGMHFSIGVFTNLSRDHLDFHHTMENYKEAKKSLFRDNTVEKRVINSDDPVGREILAESHTETLTTGIDYPADVMAEDYTLSENGSSFTLKTPAGSRAIESHLLGKHNIHNLLSAAAAALLQGVSLDHIIIGLRSVDRIPGRFERVTRGQKFSVVVDYAHTDDALRNALLAAKTFVRNQVIVVFGCGGDRDRGKRKEMGRVALELSDHAVVTSDNPRTEDPEQIIQDILEGVPSSAIEGSDYAVLPDRREAIHYAVNRATAGDLVLIAGKGHEDYQILNTGTIHFDDREVAADALKRKRDHD